VGDVPHTLADIDAAKRDFGYAPIVDFSEDSAGRSPTSTRDTMTILRGLESPCSPWALGAAPAAGEGTLTVQSRGAAGARF